jgi:anti-anti-sigma factor
VRTDDGPAGATVSLEGYLDTGTAEVLSDALDGLDAAKPLRIDLAGLTFIDSAGVGVLVRHWRRWHEATVGIELVHATDPVRRVLDVTGLAFMFDTPSS